ncbi:MULTISPECIES: preprotein translocase subunit SecG [Ramlibacter]|uniref:Protein-export membrane protein SecG n=1 Tax=Ramlibacter aquaticus TaxID=2780094 RepID=A0ABR9SEJ4_9BURK|nr:MULTISPECIES: preprotein translocase subunit SecG [Ramlibacter]MBE7940768.1 preprotein translocase subunit SecG [Ramlibacter aquaticus]
MNVLLTIVLAVQMLAAVGMIGLILIQHGKGADMGAAFGSGSSGSLFGASGSANFLSRTTAVLAAVFFACTLALAYFGNLRPATDSAGSVLERAGVPAAAPASSAQIPASVGQPAASAAAVPAAPASGAAQIPTK